MVLEIEATDEQERFIKEMLLAMRITFNSSDYLHSASGSFEMREDGNLGQSLQECLRMWKDSEYLDFTSFRNAVWGGRGIK